MNVELQQKFAVAQQVKHPLLQNLPQGRIKNYQQFYQFYLTEHRNLVSRRLHVAGSTIGMSLLVQAVRKKKLRYVPIALVAGYTCSWLGHFIFEKNKPATFQQPFYSFISDWRMLSDVLRGRLSLIDRKKDKIPS